MKVTLSIDSKQSTEIKPSDLATIIGDLPDDLAHAILFAPLCDHPSSEVRCAIAGLSYMSSDTLEILARDASIEAVRQVANNKRALQTFKAPLILEMIRRDVSVALEISGNLSWILVNEIREEVIQALLLHTDSQVVEATRDFKDKVDERQRRRMRFPRPFGPPFHRNHKIEDDSEDWPD